MFRERNEKRTKCCLFVKQIKSKWYLRTSILRLSWES